MLHCPSLEGKRLRFPKPRVLATYDAVRTRLVDQVERISDVVAVYEFGTVNAPGLSDLDLAVVIRDVPAERGVASEIASISFSPEAQDILCGSTTMIFREKDFPDITLWDDVNVRLLFGKKILLSRFSENEEHELEICRILDWLPERVLSLWQASSRETIEVAHVLGLLYSLRITFSKIRSLIPTPSTKPLEVFCGEITRVREVWFDFDDKERVKQLERLVASALTEGARALRLVENFLSKEGYYRFDRSKARGFARFCLHETYGYSFTDDIHEEEQFFLPVPYLWALHLAAYARQSGVISERLRQAFKPWVEVSVDIKPSLNSLLKRRMRWINELAEFLKRYRFEKGLYKFGWFY